MTNSSVMLFAILKASFSNIVPHPPFLQFTAAVLKCHLPVHCFFSLFLAPFPYLPVLFLFVLAVFPADESHHAKIEYHDHQQIALLS